jgi:V8-like Glu-specific endopeptidase
MANRWMDQFSATDIAAAHDFERALRGDRSFPALQPFGGALRRPSPEATEDYGETPIRGDDRVQVRNVARRPSTRLFPFNTICLVRTAAAEDLGSGTLITPQVMLTAGHVLTGMSSVTITPGADMSAATDELRRPANPRTQTVSSSRFRFHPTLDVALALMPTPFTRPSEFMMLQPRGNANTATLLSNAGYPGGTTDLPRGWSTGTMWRHSDQVPIAGVTPTQLFYPIDTSPGHSGSPLWLLGNDGIRLLLAVHTNGEGGCSPNRNCGVRITCGVITWIENECRSAGLTGPRVDRVAFRRTCSTTTT